MLNFLNTAILVAAAAAVFPFLLHLFSRRKVKVVPFSSIAYLKAMQKHQVRAIKIKQVLLLIIRTLVILMVVLAFARPASRGGYLGSHATVSAVIILDNSASMGLSVKDGRLFDLARRKAKAILDQMGQSDEATVIATVGTYGKASGEELFGSPAAGAEVLERIEITDGRADLTETFATAVSLVSERANLNREIYLISDFQENSFDPEHAPVSFPGRVLMVDLFSGDVDNTGIVDFDPGNQLIEVGTEFTVTATMKRWSGAADNEVLVSLYLDGDRVAQDGLRPGAGETESLPFNLTVNEPGYHSGYVSLSDDDLLADNRYYFSFYIPERFTVLLAGEGDLTARLFRLALAPDETVRRHWSVKDIAYADFSSVNLSGYDVLILADYRSLPEGDIARIREYVKKGGGLLVNLGRRADSARFNAAFGDLTGVTLTSEFPRQFSRGGYYVMSDFDLEHQILSVFKSDGSGEELQFRTYALNKGKLSDNNSARLLARHSDGSPAVTASDYGRGRVMVLNCDVTPDISDISLHPFFVPFVVRSCEFLSSDFSSQAETISAGDAPGRVLRKSFNIKNEFVLVMPDGRRRMLTGGFRDDQHLVDCGRLEQSGIYAIFNGTTESDRFAVNIDAKEGDLYRTDWDELATRLGGAKRLPNDADLAGFISEQRFGREWWQYVLILAVILLLLEMLVARDRTRQSASDE